MYICYAICSTFFAYSAVHASNYSNFFVKKNYLKWETIEMSSFFSCFVFFFCFKSWININSSIEIFNHALIRLVFHTHHKLKLLWKHQKRQYISFFHRDFYNLSIVHHHQKRLLIPAIILQTYRQVKFMHRFDDWFWWFQWVIWKIKLKKICASLKWVCLFFSHSFATFFILIKKL